MNALFPAAGEKNFVWSHSERKLQPPTGDFPFFGCFGRAGWKFTSSRASNSKKNRQFSTTLILPRKESTNAGAIFRRTHHQHFRKLRRMDFSRKKNCGWKKRKRKSTSTPLILTLKLLCCPFSSFFRKKKRKWSLLTKSRVLTQFHGKKGGGDTFRNIFLPFFKERGPGDWKILGGIKRKKEEGKMSSLEIGRHKFKFDENVERKGRKGLGVSITIQSQWLMSGSTYSEIILV